MKNEKSSIREREKDVLSSDAIHEYDEQEVDEVSLDPKWATALREISIRLTNQKAMQAHDSQATLSNDGDDNSISSFATQCLTRTFAESKNQNPQHDAKNRTDCLLDSGHASESCTPLIEMRLHDDNSLTVTTSIKNKRRDGSFDDKEIPPRAKSNPSFITALVHNARCSFHSRSRSKSRSRGNNVKAAEMISMSNDEKERVSEKESGLPHLQSPPDLTDVFEPPLEAKMNPQTELKPLAVDVPASEQQGIREPYTHPEYKLGDTAREEDMVVFNKTSQQGSTSTKNSTSSESDEEFSMSKGEEFQIDVIQRTIGQLQHLDAAFGKLSFLIEYSTEDNFINPNTYISSVLRSDNRWTYALVADRTNKGIRFVVDNRGSTKTYSPEKWATCVRRVRALTMKQNGHSFYRSKSG